MVGSDDDDEELDSEDGGDDDDEDSTEPEEFGIDEDELMDPSDDDDHSEMGELGSEHEDAEEDMLDDSDFDSEEEESEEGEEGSDEGSDEGNSGNMTATFDMPAPPPPPSTAAAVAAPTRYVPPHLRQAGATAAPTPSPFPAEVTPAAPSLDSPPEDPRLRRQILGLLNKLSSSNMPSIIAALEAFYTSHPRALVSTTLTSLLLEIVSGRDNLGEAFIITYAALVAALSKSVGIEFPAGVVARCVGLFDEAREKSHLAAGGEGDGGFEGRPGSKECENLVAFLAELYNFQVIACVLIYDLVKLFIDSGLEELEVELLVKVVKRAFFLVACVRLELTRGLHRLRTATSPGRPQFTQGYHRPRQAEDGEQGRCLDEVRPSLLRAPLPPLIAPSPKLSHSLHDRRAHEPQEQQDQAGRERCRGQLQQPQEVHQRAQEAIRFVPPLPSSPSLTTIAQDQVPKPSVSPSPISARAPPRASGGSSVRPGAEIPSSRRSSMGASTSRSLRTRR